MVKIGLGLKILNPGNYRNMVMIAKLSNRLEKHIKKRCAYCDMDLGNDIPVVEFVEHMAEKHLDKIEARDVEDYRKLIKRVTG